ncbi:hypothetical protein [Coleofasciculus chthonoplastes]|uniref:hypothetical protein n=1 Tax=Coleofasciculus chthonoplastes TaxID=64178 RepID=UPI003304AD4A
MIATIDQKNLVSLTQDLLVDEIKLAAAKTSLGIPFDEYTSGTDKYLVFEVVQDANAAFGKIYHHWQIRFDLRIYSRLYSDWVAANKTGLDDSGSFYHDTLNNTDPVTLLTVNGGSEYQFIIFSQGSILVVLGGVYPAKKPDWWDLSSWNYYFTPDYNDYRRFRSTAKNPFSNQYHDVSLKNSRMETANIHTGRRDILQGILFFTQSNQGISGKSSDDLVSCSAAGSSLGDVIEVVTGERYLVLDKSAGGLGVRIA